MYDFKEILMVTTNFVLAGAAIAALYGLLLHRSTVKLQRRNLNATLFNELSRNISNLLDSEPGQDNKKELEHWYIRLFNAFEHFAFFANRDYLSDGMKEYYKNFILAYCSRLEKELPKTFTSFQEEPRHEYSELRAYCERFPL